MKCENINKLEYCTVCTNTVLWVYVLYCNNVFCCVALHCIVIVLRLCCARVRVLRVHMYSKRRR